MAYLDEQIKTIDNHICKNIDICARIKESKYLEDESIGFHTQSILSSTRSLLEHIVAKHFFPGEDVSANKSTIDEAKKLLRKSNKFPRLAEFLNFIQRIDAHNLQTEEGAKRIMVKYRSYYFELRKFAKNIGVDILHNLEKYPWEEDKTTADYQMKIASAINGLGENPENKYLGQYHFMYKISPFSVGDEIYFEITLRPAYNTSSKFDRIVCYSKRYLGTHYSIRPIFCEAKIKVLGKDMPIKVITDYSVSVRPCELNYLAYICGFDTSLGRGNKEYKNTMDFMTSTGKSFLDIALMEDDEYKNTKQTIFGSVSHPCFDKVLDKAREIIRNKEPGANVLRYLLHFFNNKVIKDQKIQSNENSNWSKLRLTIKSKPFDDMPWATSLCKHNPDGEILFECIPKTGRDHELFAKALRDNMNNNGQLYISKNEMVAFPPERLDSLMAKFNGYLSGYSTQQSRIIKPFRDYYYQTGAYEDTRKIIDTLVKLAENGSPEHSHDMAEWLANHPEVDSDEKKDILANLFSKSMVAMIYGAAGTGKTHLLKYLDNFSQGQKKLYLSITNASVEHLKHTIGQGYGRKFMSISRCKKLFSEEKFIPDRKMDYLIIDECSTVPNRDMFEILRIVDFKHLILIGDTYQIEAISFGNWFSLAKSFVPPHAIHILEVGHRTTNTLLSSFWEKVRINDPGISEDVVWKNYACPIDETLFTRQSDDEIVLCLNYDGIYGINSLNRFFQANNPNKKEIRWGVMSYKVGDPVLFNENNMFSEVLHNNLKGTIKDIELSEAKDCIEFTIEIDCRLSEDGLDMFTPLQILESPNNDKSIIKFTIHAKTEQDDDRDWPGDTDIPFQIAYAVSIHKAQGLEYDSVKIVIPPENCNLISHQIFYTAITRAKNYLKIYWSPETQQTVISGFRDNNMDRDADVFEAHSKMIRYDLRKVKSEK